MSSDRIPIGKVIPGRPVGLPEPEGVPSVKRGDRQSESPVGLKNGTRNPPPASFTAQNSIETKAPHSKGNHKSMPRASSPRPRGSPVSPPSTSTARSVPPLRGTPRPSSLRPEAGHPIAAVSPSTPSSRPSPRAGTVRERVDILWSLVIRWFDEANRQLTSLYRRYPYEALASVLGFGVLILVWPAQEHASTPFPNYFRQRMSSFGGTSRNTESSPGPLSAEGDEVPAERDLLDLDGINTLLERFERRTRVITISANKPLKRNVRTIRVGGSSGSFNHRAPARGNPIRSTDQPVTSPTFTIRRLTHTNRDALTAQVLRIISRHGKRGVDRRELARSIVAEALRQDYDPLFVAAVIKSESAFNTYARSYVGAQGLMQIMPATARYVEGMNALPRGNLSDPGHNLHLGVKYLKYLEDMYKGNRILTLMAYNWGPGHIERTIKGGRRRGVPREVVNYALRILSDHSRWVDEANQTMARADAASRVS
jgi:hypothetical protein